MNIPDFLPIAAVASRSWRRLVSAAVLSVLSFHATAWAQHLTERQTITATDAIGFGLNVAASGASVIIGDSGKHGSQPFRNTAHVFVQGASGWTLQQKFVVEETDVAIDGDTAIAGGRIYTRAGTTWTQQGSVPTEHSPLALRGDTLVVGYPYNSASDTGRIGIFTRSGGVWSQMATLTPPAENGPSQMFGSAVALDGDTLMVGTATKSGPGLAYVYVRTGDSWLLQATLSVPGAQFGQAMDVAIDGNVAAVGNQATRNISIFNRSGTTWTETQKVAPTDYAYTNQLALKNGVLAISTASSCLLYVQRAAGWTLGQKLPTDDSTDIALSEDGNVLVIGNAKPGATTSVCSIAIPPTPGSGWRDYEVGSPRVKGGSSDDGTTVTVRGSGADIANEADQFHFRTETMTGNGTLVARVTSAGDTHAWAKVGLMAREAVTPAARTVMAMVTPGDHLGTLVRSAPTATLALLGGAWQGAPIWLKLVRTDDLFESYASADGQSWQPMGSTTVRMARTIHLGLAVCSHNNAVLNTATFDHVNLITDGPPPNPTNVPPAPATLTIARGQPYSLGLQWPDADNSEVGFEIERAVEDGAFTLLATVPTNTTGYADNGLEGGTKYFYRVRAVNSAGASGYSPVVADRAASVTNSEWSFGWDIGSPSPAGAGSGIPPNVTMFAGGSDFFGTADSGRMQYAQILGDFLIIARVASMTNTHPWAKAGVMVRGDLGSKSQNIAMLLTADNTSVFQARTTYGGETSSVTGPWVHAPYWVKLTRVGNTFSGYVSTDARNWTLVGSQELVISDLVVAGVVASSHNTGARTTVNFQEVTLTATKPPVPPPAQPSNFNITQVTQHSAQLTWNDNSTDEEGFHIYLRGPDGNTQLFSTGANATTMTLENLAKGTVYGIEIASFRGTVESSHLNSAFSTRQQPDDVPAAPTGLTVQPVDASSLRLAWTDNSAWETGYEIERRVGEAAFARVGTTAANATTFTDTGLTAGTTYAYRVRTMNGTAFSDYSAVATGTPGGGPPPPPPPPPEGWTGRDIGTTGSAGSESGTPPTVTMNAGGTDIVGTADGFHGVFSTATGDLTIVAHVASMTNTHPWAKAGVMIRASLEANAPNAAMVLTAGNVCVFQTRTSVGGDTAGSFGGYFNAPYWVKLTRVGNTFSGYISPDGVTWTLVGHQDIVMSGAVYIGLAGSSHTTSAQTVISFDHVAKTTATEPPPPPPSAWSQQLWGVTNSSVSIGAAGDSMTIAGQSDDIWDRSDSGTFVHHEATGDYVIEARMDSMTFSNAYAKGGLMFRVGTAANAANVAVVVTCTQGVIFQARSSAGDVSVAVRDAWGPQAPVWLRLGRSGNNFLAAYSTDNRATWISLGTVTIAMPATVNVGVVGASHNTAASSTLSVSGIVD